MGGNPWRSAGGKESTFLIAASNSKNKSTADYICSGTDDDVQAQAAMDTLPVTGGKIFLLDGTFNFSSQVTRAINNVLIEGQGAATKINLDGYTPVFSAGSQNGWVFENIATDSGGFDCGTKQNEIINCWKEGTKVNSFHYPAISFRKIASVEDAGYTGSHDVEVKDGYAFSCDYSMDTFTVIDIHDPANPFVVAHLTDGTRLNGIHDIVIDGDYAYVTNIIRNSVASIDISDPLNPFIADELVDDNHLDGTHFLVKKGDYIYAADLTWNHDSVSIIDASDPTNLSFASHLDTSSVPGGGNSWRGIAASDDYIFVGSYNTGYLIAVDVSDKASPSIVGSVLLESGGHLVDVKIKGDYVFVTDTEHGKVFSVDISDPTTPAVIDSIYLGETNYIELFEHYAFVSNPDDQSIFALNISDPANLSVIGSYGDPTRIGSLAYASGMYVWGKYLIVSPRDTQEFSITIFEIGQGVKRLEVLNYLNCHAEDNDYVHAAVTGTGATVTVTTGITNPDLARTVSITTTNNGSTESNCWVYGFDLNGNALQENVLATPGATNYSENCFSIVTQFRFMSSITAADTVSVGISDKIGLPNRLASADDVLKIKINGGDVTDEFSMATDVSISRMTLDMSSLTAGGIVTGDDIEIMYKALLNTE